jgi:hypothetical protein
VNDLAPNLEIHYQDDAMCSTLWHNLHLAVYVQALRIPHIDAIESGLLKLARRHPGQIISLSVLLPHSPLSDMSVMRYAQRLLPPLNNHVRLMAVAFEFEGVGATLIRTMLRSFSVIAHIPGSIRFYPGSADACEEIAPMIAAAIGAPVEAANLLALFAALRGRLP